MPFFFHIGTVRLSCQSVYCVISSVVLDKSVPSDVVLPSSILRCKTSWIQNFGSHLFAFQCSNGMLSVSVAFFDFVCLNLSSTSIMLIRRTAPNVGSACISGWWASSVEIWPKYLHYLSVAARQSVSKIPALSLTQHKYWTSCVRGYRIYTRSYWWWNDGVLRRYSRFSLYWSEKPFNEGRVIVWMTSSIRWPPSLRNSNPPPPWHLLFSAFYPYDHKGYRWWRYSPLIYYRDNAVLKIK